MEEGLEIKRHEHKNAKEECKPYKEFIINDEYVQSMFLRLFCEYKANPNVNMSQFYYMPSFMKVLVGQILTKKLDFC